MFTIQLKKLDENKKVLNYYEKKVDSVEPSSGHACLYIGFDDSSKNLGIKDTNLWVYPSYNHDQNVIDFNKDQNNDFPVLYMSFASSKDPEWNKNYPSKSTMEVIVPSRFENYKQWANKSWRKRGQEYEHYKEELSQRIIKQVYKHCPHLKNKISFYELSTPLSTKSLANYRFGELYGINHTPQRFKQKWLKPKTPIKNLFLSGQDIVTVGLVGALSSGVLTTSVLLKKNMFKRI